MTKDELAMDEFGWPYDELKYEHKQYIDAHPEFNQEDPEIEKIVTEKRRQYRIAAGAMSVMIDDMSEEAWDIMNEAWRQEALVEIQNRKK